jgi:hypothetical protein
MSAREDADLENMALAAELARQLCHEFSNLIYSLFLQIEIGRVAKSASKPEDWESIRRDAEKIVSLLHEWDRFHNRFLFAEASVDLHETIRRMANDVASPERTVALAPAINGGPLTISGSAIDCRHLLRLLVEDFFQTWEEAGVVATLSVQTLKLDNRAIVHIAAAGGKAADLETAETTLSSLLAGACRSLSVRLGATLKRERDSDGRCAVSVEFPLA